MNDIVIIYDQDGVSPLTLPPNIDLSLKSFSVSLGHQNIFQSRSQLMASQTRHSELLFQIVILLFFSFPVSSVAPI